MEKPARRLTIMDMDTGVDDAMAIMLALNSPRLDVRAITVTDGNVAMDQCALNTVRVSNFVKREMRGDLELPVVAKGEGIPGYSAGAGEVHGGDGLGGFSGELSFDGEKDFVRGGACGVVRGILENAAAAGRKVTLVTTGPLTNPARWTLEIPGLLRDAIDEIVVMGGAFFRPGNVTPHAEFNIRSDPGSAARLFDFCRGDEGRPAIPLTCVGLDVTMKAILERGLVNRLLEEHPGNRALELIKNITGIYMDFDDTHYGVDGCFLHDPLAVGVAVERSLCTVEKHCVEVETRDGEKIGMTRVTEGPASAAHGVCVDVDADKFIEFFLSRAAGINSW